MTTFQKWLAGLAALLGIGTVAVITKPSPTPTPPPPPAPVETTVTPSPVTPPVTPSTSPWIVGDSMAYPNTATWLTVVSSTLGGSASPSTALYTDGWYANLVSVDPSIAYHGHPTLKLNMPGGTKNTPALWASLKGPYDKIWFHAVLRYSPGFTTTGTLSNTNNAFKVLAWQHANYDGSGRLEIANTTQYQLYWNVQAKNTGTLVGGGKYAFPGSITTEWTDGAWYEYVIEVDRTTNPAVISVWIGKDGAAPTLTGSTPESMQNGSPMPQVTGIGFSIEFNQSRAVTQTQALWVGQWDVIDGTKYPNPYSVHGGT